MKSKQEQLKKLGCLSVVPVDGAYMDRLWSGYVFMAMGVQLGTVRVWDNGEINFDGPAFETNAELAGQVMEIIIPKLRVVK